MSLATEKEELGNVNDDFDGVEFEDDIVHNENDDDDDDGNWEDGNHDAGGEVGAPRRRLRLFWP